jgi:very-short-patch-repair endonuclease
VSVSHLLIVCALLAVGFELAERIARDHPGHERSWPVYARPVLSEAERNFHARLRAAIPQFAVLCQVNLGQFIEVDDRRRHLGVRNRYDRLSADFVVCTEDFRPLLVVELDDSSHDRSVQRDRDSKKDAVLAAAGVPVVRFRGMVPGDQIRATVLRALGDVDERPHPAEDIAGARRKIPFIGSI